MGGVGVRGEGGDECEKIQDFEEFINSVTFRADHLFTLPCRFLIISAQTRGIRMETVD